MARLVWTGFEDRQIHMRQVMKQNSGPAQRRRLAMGLLPALVLVAAPALARTPKPPEIILPPPPVAVPAVIGAPAAGATPSTAPAIAPLPVTEPALVWSLADAQALLTVIGSVDSEGLFPADYQPDALRAAIAAGEGAALDVQAGKSFTWLVEDMRDGRTPVSSRLQWFAVDPDQDVMPTPLLMHKALDTHDVTGVVASLAPTHPDYAVLKAALAATPAADRAVRTLIRANMDRWRWMPHDLGNQYLITNLPEFQLRMTVRDKIIRTYRTIVGKPGKTATPQLYETVEGVIFNPTWTVPQSIVKGEGLGARLIGNVAGARAQGYAVTKSADGTITVVQQPGPGNSLGMLKLDMPNPHAIFLHDTNARGLFNSTFRALSHGCVRTDRAVELGMTLAILGAGMAPEDAAAISRSGKYTRVPITRTMPVYITYFTMGQDITGKLTRFTDIYTRDAPVLASFVQPRQIKTAQRSSTEAIIVQDNPL